MKFTTTFTKSPSLFLKIDLVKVYPLCRVNCDNNGEQKICTINGETRMRISSQCVRRELRQYFKFMNEVNLAELIEFMQSDRFTEIEKEWSLYLSKGEVNFILNHGKESEETLQKELDKFLDKNKDDNEICHLSLGELKFGIDNGIKAFSKSKKEKDSKDESNDSGNKKGSKKKNADADAESSKESAKKDNEDKDLLSNISTVPVSPEISMFGRMYASCTKANVLSPVMVGQSISFNRINPERDFFCVNSSNKDRDGFVTGNDNRVLTDGVVYTPIYLDFGMLYNNLVKDPKNPEPDIRTKLKDLAMQLVNAAFNLQLHTGQSNTAHFTKPSILNVSVSSNLNYIPNILGDVSVPDCDSTKEIIDVANHVLNDLSKYGKECSPITHDFYDDVQVFKPTDFSKVESIIDDGLDTFGV